MRRPSLSNRFASSINAVAKADFALGRLFEPDQYPQQGALAATAAPDNGDKLTGKNVEVYSAQNPILQVVFTQPAKARRKRRAGACCFTGAGDNLNEIVEVAERLDRHAAISPIC